MSTSDSLSQRRLRLPAFLFALALLTLGLSPLPGLVPAASAQSVQLDWGHMDIFTISADGNQLKLQLQEDVTGQHVRHDPEDVELIVKESTFTKDTADYAEIGSSGYLLDQSGADQQSVIWPGWDTQDLQGTSFSASSINFEEVSGPGRVWLFSTGGLGSMRPLLADGGIELTSGARIDVGAPTHVHANWLFERAGTYTMRVYATADGATDSAVKTYTWTVGDPLNDLADNPDKAKKSDNPTPASDRRDSYTPSSPALGVSTNVGTSTRSTNNSTKSDSNRGTVTVPRANVPAAPAVKPAQGNAPSAAAEKKDTSAGGANSAPVCTPGQTVLRPLIKDDRSAPPAWVDPSSLHFVLGDAAKQNTPSALGPIPAGDVWMIGATQQPNVPWLGVNTQHPDLLGNIDGDVTFALTGAQGPGDVFVFTQGSLGKIIGQEWFTYVGGKASGSTVVVRNSHVHPNFVFSAPGSYTLDITQTAKLKNGKEVSGTAKVSFTVGGGEGVTEGHFDLGADIATGAETCTTAGGSTAGATGKGSAAAGKSTKALANTGADATTLALIAFGIGVLIFGAGFAFYLRNGKQLNSL